MRGRKKEARLSTLPSQAGQTEREERRGGTAEGGRRKKRKEAKGDRRREGEKTLGGHRVRLNHFFGHK